MSKQHDKPEKEKSSGDKVYKNNVIDDEKYNEWLRNISIDSLLAFTHWQKEHTGRTIYPSKKSYHFTNFGSNNESIWEPIKIYNNMQGFIYSELETIHTYLSDGLDVSKLKIQRTVKISVYCKKTEEGLKFVEAVLSYAKSLGIEVIKTEKPVINSWFQRFIGKVTPKTKEELGEVYSKGKEVLTTKYIDKEKANVDETLVNSATDLLDSIKAYDDSIVRIGRLLTVSRTIDGKKRVYVNQLTDEQVIYIENNPHLLQKPDDLIEGLTQLALGTEV